MTTDREKRRYPRRRRAMRFRFDYRGDTYRAVSTNVSPGGMFLKAMCIPESGARLVLREIKGNERDLGLRIRARVVWNVPRATLDRPETGFAVEFVETYCIGNHDLLQLFVDKLAIPEPEAIVKGQREGVEAVIYEFKHPPLDGQGYAIPQSHPGLPGLAPGGDLDRLRRQQEFTREPSRPLSRPGVRPRGAARPARAVPPPEAADPRKRTFGGLLGMFGEPGPEAELSEHGLDAEPGFDGPEELSPTFDGDYEDSYVDGDDWYVEEDDPREVLLSWKTHEAGGRIEQITAEMVAVKMGEHAPMQYERVSITPSFPSIRNPRLIMHGTVSRMEDKQADGTQTVLVRFTEIDERSEGGVFGVYLQLFRDG